MIPAYLRADFPTSKWVFTPTESDLLKPAATVVMELDAGGISRIARRTPVRPRRRSAPPTALRTRPGSTVAHAPMDAHSAVSTFVNSVTERAVLACVEAAGRLADDHIGLQAAQPSTQHRQQAEDHHHNSLVQHDEVEAPTFAWDQKLRCAGRFPRSPLRSPRLCRQSPIIRWRLCALPQLDNTRAGGSTRLETQLALKIAQVELSAVENVLTENMVDDTISEASSHSVALVPGPPAPASAYRRRRILSLPCVTRTVLTNSARQQAAARKEAHRRAVAARRRCLLLQEQRRLAQPLKPKSIERNHVTQWLTLMRLVLASHAMYYCVKQSDTIRAPSRNICNGDTDDACVFSTIISPDQERAVVMLQCTYRLWRQHKLMNPGVKLTKHIVYQEIARARAEKRRRERDEAIAIIKVCLNPLNRTGLEIRVAVRTFLDCVRRCQRTVRPYLALREIRLNVLHRIWLFLERVIFHPASSQLFAATRRLGGVCPSTVGPKLAQFADATKHERIDRHHGQDAFWRVPNDARVKGIRRIFSELLHQHISERTEHQRQHKHRRPSKRLDMQDVHLFITNKITIDTLQLKAKADAPKVPSPDFVVYSRAPPLILDALKHLYHKRRERRTMLDPAYDKELLRQIDAVLGGTIMSISSNTSKGGASSPKTPAAQPNSMVVPAAAETPKESVSTRTDQHPSVLIEEKRSVLEIECTS